MGKTICIDLDGTIAHFTEWQGEQCFGEVVDGCQKALQKLKENSYTIIIFTTRASKEIVESFLKSNSIPFDYVNENPNQPLNAIGGKLYADVYIDDRAIQFNGNWDECVGEVLKFKTWETISIGSDMKSKYAIDFLTTDFSQSYLQMRHYDTISWDITKFCFVELLLGITSVWAIYSYAIDDSNQTTVIANNFRWIIPSILGLCYTFSLLGAFLISRNRVYFTKVAKYINDHRHFSLSEKPLGFENRTNFYTNHNLPKSFDMWSTHLVSLYVIQFIGAAIFSIMTFCILFNWLLDKWPIYLISGISGLLAFVLSVGLLIKYLKKNN